MFMFLLLYCLYLLWCGLGEEGGGCCVWSLPQGFPTRKLLSMEKAIYIWPTPFHWKEWNTQYAFPVMSHLPWNTFYHIVDCTDLVEVEKKKLKLFLWEHCLRTHAWIIVFLLEGDKYLPQAVNRRKKMHFCSWLFKLFLD